MVSNTCGERGELFYFTLEEFWANCLVLAIGKEWSDEDARMQHLPLYLQGDAFREFVRMAESDKSKQAEVKKVVVSGFSVTSLHPRRL